MKDITLYKTWLIKAPLHDIFKIMTDFENFPQHFPTVVQEIVITKEEGDYKEILATVKSFRRSFKVKMKTRIFQQSVRRYSH